MARADVATLHEVLCIARRWAMNPQSASIPWTQDERPRGDKPILPFYASLHHNAKMHRPAFGTWIRIDRRRDVWASMLGRVMQGHSQTWTVPSTPQPGPQNAWEVPGDLDISTTITGTTCELRPHLRPVWVHSDHTCPHNWTSSQHMGAPGPSKRTDALCHRVPCCIGSSAKVVTQKHGPSRRSPR